jgi:pyruvate/2-oxoglutarate dehydrogenase complex dihydrolipoamide dehydrogenase (E3) component
MPKYDYDMITIGAGAGGFVSSKLAAGLGKKVAMIEKNKLGGECTNAGCVPSKAILRAATIAHQARRLRDFGIETEGELRLSTRNVMQYVRSAVKKVYDSHPASVFEKLGITVLFGSPRFIDNHLIELNGKTISANKFMICTGSSALVPPIQGLRSLSTRTRTSSTLNRSRHPCWSWAAVPSARNWPPRSTGSELRPRSSRWETPSSRGTTAN